MSKSKIEWTDRTWNPIRGCSRVSEGCRNCYAETFAARFSMPGNVFHGFAERTPDGPRWTGEVALLQDRLREPMAWRKPARVFVNSMSDLFHENLTDAQIDQVFAVMALCPQHTFQVLTKRAERMRAYLDSRQYPNVAVHIQAILANADKPTQTPDTPWPLPNVWLGPSIENQPMADSRFPIAAELGEAGWNVMVSMEPLLSAVIIPDRFLSLGPRAWLIAGGESGPGARPFHVSWAKDLIRQCQSADVRCFLKQVGAVPIVSACRQRHFEWGEGKFAHFGDLQSGLWRVKLNDKKGGDLSEWPDFLRVREFPG